MTSQYALGLRAVAHSTSSTCARCGDGTAQVNLVRCGRCTIAFYCNDEHRELDQCHHSKTCTDMQSRQLELDNILSRLEVRSGQVRVITAIRNGLYEYVNGHDRVRVPWLLSRLADNMMDIPTKGAVRASLDLRLDALKHASPLQINPSPFTFDHNYSAIPFHLIDLGFDLACYDFLCLVLHKIQLSLQDISRRQHMYGNPNRRISEEPEVPPLDERENTWFCGSLGQVEVRKSNIFDGLAQFRNRASLGNTFYFMPTMAWMISLVKVLIDLRNIKASDALSPKLPQELFDQVGLRVPESDTLFGVPGVLPRADLVSDIRLIESQIQDLYRSTEECNKHYWKVLRRRWRGLPDGPSPDRTIYDPFQHTRYLEVFSYRTWMALPNALDIVFALVDGESRTWESFDEPMPEIDVLV